MTNSEINQAIRDWIKSPEDARDFCSDLNACHQIEQMFDADLWAPYVKELEKEIRTHEVRDILSRRSKIDGLAELPARSVFDIGLTHMSALRKATAMVKSIGKWKD